MTLDPRDEPLEAEPPWGHWTPDDDRVVEDDEEPPMGD